MCVYCLARCSLFSRIDPGGISIPSPWFAMLRWGRTPSLRLTFLPIVTSPDTVKWSSSSKSGMASRGNTDAVEQDDGELALLAKLLLGLLDKGKLNHRHDFDCNDIKNQLWYLSQSTEPLTHFSIPNIYSIKLIHSKK
ncbi:hypothetical protein PFISCL1PPCAC_28530, partial [Pristionchus fissidentatus]